MKIPNYLPTIAVTAAILYGTLAPKPLGDLPSPVGMDKVYHFLMMLTLTFALAIDYRRAKPGHKPLSTKALTAICTAVCAFSVLTEVAQKLLTANRTFDVYDILADCAGALTATLLLRLFLRR